jgi:hypothetical protein
MAGKGGARPGAGRKPKGIKRVIHASPIQLVEAKISEKLPWLVDKLFELAEGVEVEEIDRKGNRRIYSTIPDRQAIEYLIDRIMGKPAQPIDVMRTIREIAAAEGLSDEETAAAVAEAEAYLKRLRSGTRS